MDFKKAETRFPARPPARPEILRATPTVFVEEFESDTVDLGEASRVLSDWQALGIDTNVFDDARG